jgi:hypothetical protein
MKPKHVPNSQFTQLPWDYLHPNHAGYNAMGLGHRAIRARASSITQRRLRD